jgi:Zn-dependent protease
MPDFTPEMLAYGFLWYLVFLFSTTCHEGAHALAAKLGGDPTAFHGGQVTLNPVPHIEREPVGLVVIPLISYALTGWMMGWASAPYDPYWAARHPRRAAWMALAGPAANFLLVLLAALGIRLGLALGWFRVPGVASFQRITEAVDPDTFGFAAALLSIFFTLNLILGVFNLLPLPPLDGHTGITLLMAERTGLRFLDATRDPSLALMGIVAGSYLFSNYVLPVLLMGALRVLYPNVVWQ